MAILDIKLPTDLELVNAINGDYGEEFSPDEIEHVEINQYYADEYDELMWDVYIDDRCFTVYA